MLNIVKRMSEMKNIVFYTKENCLLCDDAYDLLKVIQEIEPFNIEVRDIYEDDDLLEEFQLIIPVIKLGNEVLFGDSINFNDILTKLKE